MTSDLQTIINALKKPMIELIKERTKNMVRRESAVVISVDNARRTATVRLGTSPDRDDQNMLLPNATGSDLDVGETVWVDMWGTPSFNAVVSMRNVFDETIR